MFDETVKVERISKKDLQEMVRRQRLQGAGTTLIKDDWDARAGKPDYEYNMYQNRQRAVAARLKKARGEKEEE